MISDSLKQTILTELGLDAYDLQDETVANEVPGWDSLSHAGIICAVEAKYKIRFKSVELLRLNSVGDLQALVDKYS